VPPLGSARFSEDLGERARLPRILGANERARRDRRLAHGLAELFEAVWAFLAVAGANEEALGHSAIVSAQ
jgi:hypothetical protein